MLKMASLEEDYMRWLLEDDDEDIIQFMRIMTAKKITKTKRSCWVRSWLKDRSLSDRNTMYKLQQELRVSLEYISHIIVTII